jgi:hypothetical protein
MSQYTLARNFRFSTRLSRQVHLERRRETRSREYETVLGREILTPAVATRLFQNHETERLLYIIIVHPCILDLVISRIIHFQEQIL